MREAVIHAAELLELDAEALKSCTTLNGQWPTDNENDKEAKIDYNDMMTTALKLRELGRSMAPTKVRC